MICQSCGEAVGVDVTGYLVKKVLIVRGPKSGRPIPKDIPWPDGADERFVCSDCIELGTADEARYGMPRSYIPECQLCATEARTDEEGHLVFKVRWVFGQKTGRPVPSQLLFGDRQAEKYYCFDCLEIGQDEVGYDFPSEAA